MSVFYICDRQACGKNHDCGRCRHTKKIEHAVNFRPSSNKHSGDFWEKVNDESKESGWNEASEVRKNDEKS